MAGVSLEGGLDLLAIVRVHAAIKHHQSLATLPAIAARGEQPLQPLLGGAVLGEENDARVGPGSGGAQLGLEPGKQALGLGVRTRRCRTSPGQQFSKQALLIVAERAQQWGCGFDGVERLLFEGLVVIGVVVRAFYLALKDPWSRRMRRCSAWPRVAQRFQVPLQCRQEGLGRRQQALFQQLEHEFAGKALGAGGSVGVTQPGVFREVAVGLALGVGVGDFERLNNALREAWRAVPARGEFTLEPAHHHGGELLRARGNAARESLVIKEFEQRGERFLVAVVRCGREEQLVLEVRREHADGTRALRVGGVAPAARGRHVVRLIDHEHVEAARECRFARGRKNLLKQAKGPLALEKVDAGDQPRKMGPRVHMQATRAAQALHELGIDNAELQAELIAHLVAPLNLDRRWADHQGAADTMTQHQFLDDQARFDGLAQAHVVGDEQVDARHADGASQWIELVVLDVDAAAKGRLQGRYIGLRNRALANGVQERVEA